MPLYHLICEKCKHSEETFYPLSSWDGLKDGEVPYPTKCPKCKSTDYHRTGIINIAVVPSTEGKIKRIKAQVDEDMVKIKKGDANTILDIAGEGQRRANSGVKYMKDVKKGIKRRK
jgi:predicted nucleic-acid-binding Zn-ribbon protein